MSEQDNNQGTQLSRRDMLKVSVATGTAAIGAAMMVPGLAEAKVPAPAGTSGVACGAGAGAIEVYPTSPLIMQPFTDPLPIPTPLKPTDPTTWAKGANWVAPNPQTGGQQDSDGVVHSVGTRALGLRDPLYYRIPLQVGAHSFSSSPVQPINSNGQAITLPNGWPVKQQANGQVAKLPDSTVYGFNGKFPGALLNVSYGQPVSVRFVNELDQNPLNLDRGDFGDTKFLTHCHNGHTAPESDGNPNHKPEAYGPSQWVDNLYLNYPAGNDPGQKQSTLWFHDHREGHTGANVYKGMVGLMPVYDPTNNLDNGDERLGYRLPGVFNAGTGAVDYDIMLGFYDVNLDDGTTPHQDFHNGCGETHPEQYGKTYFRHFPNHGFVGDIFTVNGMAYPVLRVKRRRYRFRMLDCSIARLYHLSLMYSPTAPVASKDTGRKGVQLQGQYQLPNGQQCMKMVQVASEGGLLPYPMLRNGIELWPAKRREVIVDFSKFMDGSPTCSSGKEEVIYLVNTLQMTNGRKPDGPLNTVDPVTGDTLATPQPNAAFDPKYKVPVMKIIIEPGDVTDNSYDPIDWNVKDANKTCTLKLDKATGLPTMKLRPLSVIPNLKGLTTRRFELQRSGKFGGETQWLINGLPFDPSAPLAYVPSGAGEVWTIKNGGGGWVHPMHLHMEEHRVIMRNRVPTPAAEDPRLYNRTWNFSDRPDDIGREDVVHLDGGDEITLFRHFRTFRGKYVAHCHNLAHEDHAMMFPWNLI